MRTETGQGKKEILSVNLKQTFFKCIIFLGTRYKFIKLFSVNRGKLCFTEIKRIGLPNKELLLSSHPGTEDVENLVFMVREHQVSSIIPGYVRDYYVNYESVIRDSSHFQDEMVGRLTRAKLDVHHPVHPDLFDGLEPFVVDVLPQLHREAGGGGVLGPVELGGVEPSPRFD